MNRRRVRRLALVATALLVAAGATATPAAATIATPVVKAVAPTTGRTAGGTTVTVTGSGFAHVAKVEFGTTAGTRLSVKSATKLTIVAPAHTAATVDVRVEVKSGSTTKTSATHTSDHYTYYAPPTVTGVSPTKGSTTGATTVTITGTSFHSITKVEFGTAFGAGLRVTSATTLTVVAPKHAAGTVDVRVIGAYGTSAVASKDRYLYVSPTPAWHALEAPLPAGHDSAPQVNLISVACPATTNCAAVGAYRDANDKPQGLIDLLTGSSWVGGPAPLPGNAGTVDSNLASVACASASACVAVGSYFDTSNHEDALIDTRTSVNWTATEPPLPGDAATSPNATLSAVACPAAGTCFAVGSYTDKTDGVEGLIETLASGSWTATEAPLPSGAIANTDTVLDFVSCWGVGACVTVGTYLSSDEEGVIELLSSGTWHASPMPLPTDRAAADQFVVVNGLSCDSSADCAVAGGYSDSQGRHAGVIVTIDNGVSAAFEAPLPANSDSATDAAVDGVSCTSGTACIAAGYYFTSSTVAGLFETISGDSAIATEAPLPTGATSRSMGFAAITCESSTCRATGTYTDDSGVGHAVIETLASGTWSAINAPLPANDYDSTPASNEETILYSGTFVGSTYVAVGVYPDTRVDNQGFIDTDS